MRGYCGLWSSDVKPDMVKKVFVLEINVIWVNLAPIFLFIILR